MSRDRVEKIKEECLMRLQEEHSLVTAVLEGQVAPTYGPSAASSLTELYLLQRQTQQKLARIEKAQQRSQAGIYGACETCGQPMWERLQVMPYAELCLDCQTRKETGPKFRTHRVH